jgi:hypothetical protein
MRNEMNDTSDPRDDAVENETAQILRQATPRGVRPELRPRVLAAVDHQLRSQTRPRWERIYWPAAAAAILLGILLNYWVAKSGSERVARIMGPPVVSRRAAELAADIAAITDEATGRWAYEQLAACCRPRDPFRSHERPIPPDNERIIDHQASRHLPF